MTALLQDLAAFVADVRFDQLDGATIEHVKLHAFDSLGLALAGTHTDEALATLRVFASTYSNQEAPLAAALRSAGVLPMAASWCVAARLTECDDIHLPSSTTPGSVVFPVALILGSASSCSGRRLIEAAVAGYEVMTAIGEFAGGANAVYRGTWPTYLGAALTAAATAARVWDLAEESVEHALAIAATVTRGLAGNIAEDPSSRWLTLGCAVQNGILAARAAALGVKGDRTLLAQTNRVLGIEADSAAPVGLSKNPRLNDVSLKPYQTSRQGLGATEAFAGLLRDGSLDVRTVDRIEVIVPEPYRQMIDRSRRPTSKTESRGIPYQLGLTALHPDELFDLNRTNLRSSELDMCRLMDRVTVQSSESFTRMYPLRWPGAVRVTSGGQVLERTEITPKGDPQNPLGWAGVESKLGKIATCLGQDLPISELSAAVGRLETLDSLYPITDALLASF